MKPFNILLAEYKRYVEGLGHAENSIREHMRTVSHFYDYLTDRGKRELHEVMTADVIGYIEHLQSTPSKLYKRPYGLKTIQRRFYTIKAFFRYLYMCEYILVNPVEDTKPEFSGEEKTRGIFTLDEISAFLDSIDINENCGQRDRALFELMYSSALRTGETANLDVTDIDLQGRTLLIRQGKGDKDSYVPFSETALVFLRKYMTGERKNLLKGLKREERQALFLSHNGRITRGIVVKRFRRILEDAGIPKKNRSPHSIRHSTATHLLEAGADVRFVSELLRHDNIQTTVRYTHLPIENLKRAYRSAHPRENTMYEEITEEYVNELEKLQKELLQINWGGGMKDL